MSKRLCEELDDKFKTVKASNKDYMKIWNVNKTTNDILPSIKKTQKVNIQIVPFDTSIIIDDDYENNAMKSKNLHTRSVNNSLIPTLRLT